MKSRKFELTNYLSQECTFSQSPSEQFQADTSLHLVLFNILLRLVSHNVYTCVPGVTLAIAFVAYLPIVSSTHNRFTTALSHALLVIEREQRSRM